MSYCDFVRDASAHPVHVQYHDHEYGFPIADDRELFERLILEINQAGLSWEIILKKREGFRAVYDGFDIATVAACAEADIARILSDARVIRNRLKVAAAIHNAGRILELQAAHGSFAAWLDANRTLTKAEWVALFKKTFKFTGGEIVGEFLMSIGILPGAHDADCPVAAVIANKALRR